MPTPHIGAQKGDIAKIVLMPGDPLRAKLFSETYLKDTKIINEVRGMLGYTGTYNGIEITVMGHGMGLESSGIYVYELYTYYEVDIIIRFGSCGSYNEDINVMDIIIGEKGFTQSNYGSGYGFEGIDTISADKDLLKIAKKISQAHPTKRKVVTTTVNSSMWFYKTHNHDDPKYFVDKGIDVVDMEAYAIYAIAKSLSKKALVLLTVSDHIVKGDSLSSDERRTAFNDMFEIILGIVEEL